MQKVYFLRILLIAVSYTHLDVYKRQIEYRPEYVEFRKDGSGRDK